MLLCRTKITVFQGTFFSFLAILFGINPASVSAAALHPWHSRPAQSAGLIACGGLEPLSRWDEPQGSHMATEQTGTEPSGQQALGCLRTTQFSQTEAAQRRGIRASFKAAAFCPAPAATGGCLNTTAGATDLCSLREFGIILAHAHFLFGSLWISAGLR